MLQKYSLKVVFITMYRIVVEDFIMLLQKTILTPPPLASNWPLIGTKLNCRRSLTANGEISNQATELKMTMHIGFVKLCMAVTAVGDFQSG